MPDGLARNSVPQAQPRALADVCRPGPCVLLRPQHKMNQMRQDLLGLVFPPEEPQQPEEGGQPEPQGEGAEASAQAGAAARSAFQGSVAAEGGRAARPASTAAASAAVARVRWRLSRAPAVPMPVRGLEPR